MTERPEREPHEYAVPPDPSGIDEPHDVLAAEEFGIGTRYERYPADPTGIREPHDTLAAEEFALPVPEQAALTAAQRARDRRRWLLLALLAVAATPVLWRRSRG